MKMKPLKIIWERLVYGDGKTCGRCGATGDEIRNAVERLKISLKPLGIDVLLEEKALDPAICAEDVSQSNRIWIGGRPLEEWLDGQVGKSPCPTCCEELGEDVECRTVEIGGNIYESIPADLIVRAGLLAADEIAKKGPAKTSCCESKRRKAARGKPCCP
jgi:hypothetical protein